jgi:hypothetical protein
MPTSWVCTRRTEMTWSRRFGRQGRLGSGRAPLPRCTTRLCAALQRSALEYVAAQDASRAGVTSQVSFAYDGYQSETESNTMRLGGIKRLSLSLRQLF